MRMEEHPACPRVEHGNEARFAAEVAGVATQIAHGPGALVKEERVEFARVVQEKLAQWIGHGEGDQVIGQPGRSRASCRAAHCSCSREPQRGQLRWMQLW